MVAAREDWWSAAACRSCDPDLFFPVSSSGLAMKQVTEAKKVCAQCPVRPECAAQSLTAREPYGVWGGFTETERLRLLAIGWQDAWQRYRRRVDVVKLEAKLRRDITRSFVGTAPGATPAVAPLTIVPQREGSMIAT